MTLLLKRSALVTLIEALAHVLQALNKCPRGTIIEVPGGAHQPCGVNACVRLMELFRTVAGLESEKRSDG